MKKARQPNLSSENEVKWRPGERLRDRRNFRKVWLEEKESMAKRDKKAKPYHAEFKREKQGISVFGINMTEASCSVASRDQVSSEVFIS